MLRRAISVLVMGSLLVAACGNDDDDDGDMPGTPDASVDASSPSRDGSATDATSPGNDATTSDASKLDASIEDSSIEDAGSDADASTVDAESDATVPPDASSFCRKFIDASYSSITTCCPDDLNSPIVLFLKEFSQFGVQPCADRITASVNHGRLSYDAAKEASCLQAVTTTSAQCPAKGPGAPKKSADCELVYRGLVPEGGSCDSDLECADGLPCQGNTCKKATTVAGGACAYPDGDLDPGIFDERKRCIDGEDCDGDTCVAPAQEGDDCFSDYDCATGLYCAGAIFNGTCEEIVPQDAGGPCVEDNFCKDGLTCHRANEADDLGTCVARKNAGESCTERIVNGTECAGYCDGATDDTPGTCHTFCGSL